MSAHGRPPAPRALDRDQALIPENYKKGLESRALLYFCLHSESTTRRPRCAR